MKGELDYLRRALDTENRSLMNELAELRKTQPSDIHNALIPTVVVNSTSVEMNMPSSDVHDLWSQSRLRQRHKASKKRRTVQDFHEVTKNGSSLHEPHHFVLYMWLKNNQYWYKIIYIDLIGSISRSSPAVSPQNNDSKR